MKKNLTILLCILVSFCQAQTLKVSYLEKINLSDTSKIDMSKQFEESGLSPAMEAILQKAIEDEARKISQGKEYELYSLNGESIYQKTKSEEIVNNNITTTIIDQIDIFYRNFKDKKTTNQTSILSKTFLIHEDETDFNWQISSETQVIAGYKCKKATSSFEQGLEAWFTNEVPINAGPKTYSGLPGLIIKVNSEYLAIEATDVDVSDNPIKIKVPSKGKKVSRKKFNEIRDKKENRNKDNEGSISIKVIQM